jgi:hypothetical protein
MGEMAMGSSLSPIINNVMENFIKCTLEQTGFTPKI